ncbi:hypothetical protein [Thalassospira sp. MCCC 1A01428]|uniref:hypothetical protein n=1 Tax=Thalassospira sp. MCCC 1A01428 TaxID=1470575 RepID=UPI000A1FFC88|nr:hypothetical protein [Thalassospira sp. MCCC 1A01428]OSQ38669.1 hypothetical protein THS27_21975 [Thalassospira sp. MCCC 1A01428]
MTVDYKNMKPYNLVLYITLPELGTLLRLGHGIAMKISENRILGTISSTHPRAEMYRDRFSTFSAICYYNDWWSAFEGWRSEQLYRGFSVLSASELLSEYLENHLQEPDFPIAEIDPDLSWLQKICVSA